MVGSRLDREVIILSQKLSGVLDLPFGHDNVQVAGQPTRSEQKAGTADDGMVLAAQRLGDSMSGGENLLGRGVIHD